MDQDPTGDAPAVELAATVTRVAALSRASPAPASGGDEYYRAQTHPRVELLLIVALQ